MRSFYFDIASLQSGWVPKPDNITLLEELQEQGYPITVITSPEDYEEAKQWLQEQDIEVEHLLAFEDNKYIQVEDKTGVLVSPNDTDLNEWFSDKIKVI